MSKKKVEAVAAEDTKEATQADAPESTDVPDVPDVPNVPAPGIGESPDEANREVSGVNQDSESNTDKDAPAAAANEPENGVSTDEVESFEPEEPADDAVTDGEDDDDDDDERIVKSGFERVSIRAVCPNGEPFRGTFSSLFFNESGETTVTVADREALEKLRNQFPALEIKEA